MSRLKELIDELCPDGVEYKPLGEVGTLTKGKGLQKKDFSESGVGCIHYGQIYTRLGMKVFEPLTFVPEAKANSFTWVERGDIIIAITSENVEDVCKAALWLGNDRIVTGAHAAVYHATAINPTFVAYFLQTNEFQSRKVMIVDGVKVIEMKVDQLAKVLIPVPPIEVQREVVRILDSFRELDNALTAEIEARERELIESRSHLFEHMATVSTVTLSSVADIQLGKMLDSEKNRGEPRPYLRNINVQNGSFDLSDIGLMRIEDTEVERFSLRSGDIIICEGGVPGRCAIWNGELPEMYYQKALHRMRCDESHLLTRYAFQWLTNVIDMHLMDSTFTGSSILHLPARVLRGWQIPLPSLDVQSRIVSLLTPQEQLIDCLRSERDARRKQFEYYRDRLLSFPEKVVS